MLIWESALALFGNYSLLLFEAQCMTPYSKRKTAFTKRMAENMQVRNFSPRTIDSYTYHVDRYAKHFAKDPEQLGPEDVRNFQLWMIRENKSSWSQFNQAVCGLRFFYSITFVRHRVPWTGCRSNNARFRSIPACRPICQNRSPSCRRSRCRRNCNYRRNCRHRKKTSSPNRNDHQ